MKDRYVVEMTIYYDVDEDWLVKDKEIDRVMCICWEKDSAQLIANALNAQYKKEGEACTVNHRASQDGKHWDAYCEGNFKSSEVTHYADYGELPE